MSAVDKAIQTQLTNIQTRTSKSLDELRAVLQQSGLTSLDEIDTGVLGWLQQADEQNC